MSQELLDVKDVQKRLRISERTVFTLIKKGELRGFKVGNKWRFTESDIQDYEDRQRRKAQEELRLPEEDASLPLAYSALVS